MRRPTRVRVTDDPEYGSFNGELREYAVGFPYAIIAWVTEDGELKESAVNLRYVKIIREAKTP